MNKTVHHLLHGLSACDISARCGVPAKWPEGHVWVSCPHPYKSCANYINCAPCRVALGLPKKAA